MREAVYSIHPRYSKLILSGEKRIEYRSIRPSKDISAFYIYETAPTSSIVGKCTVDKIVTGTPDEIWLLTRDFGAIEESQYWAYYKGKSKAVAIFIESFEKYEEPRALSAIGLARAPQAFCYV